MWVVPMADMKDTMLGETREIKKAVVMVGLLD